MSKRKFIEKINDAFMSYRSSAYFLFLHSINKSVSKLNKAHHSQAKYYQEVWALSKGFVEGNCVVH